LHLCGTNFYVGQVFIDYNDGFVEIFSFNLGINKPNDWEAHEEWDAKMRSKYSSPVDCFPEKVDQLFDALDRVRNLVFSRKELN
jgi:hypothetical protein